MNILEELKKENIEIENELLHNIEKSRQESLQENLAKNEQRAKTKLRRLVNHNLGKYKHKDKFITLTFKENIEDRKYANLEFIKFIKRLRTKYKGIQYVAVIEKQKRGAIHYHVVIYDMPFVKKEELQKTWRHGFIQINQIDQFNNLGKYLVKYLSKDLKNGRSKNEKRYFTSRGLYPPIELENIDLIKYIEDNDLDVRFVKQFKNEYIGRGAYIYCKNPHI